MTDKLKIALIAPVWVRVPPESYGGIEGVVGLLADGLIDQGHDVTLFATGDSTTKARVTAVYDRPQKELIGTIFPDVYHVSAAYDYCRQGNFDIIHDHSGFSGVALGTYSSAPVLCTLHGEFTEVGKRFFKRFKDAVYYNAISERQRHCLPDLRYVKTVYNAIDFDAFEVRAKKDNYLLALSRISPQKGAHLAIEVAKKLNKRLLLAGKIDKGRDAAYFETMIRPHIDGRQISFLGEVTQAQKRELIAGAECFIFPIRWDEPFGLVMLESMAAGTPVVAFDRGAAREVIAQGRSGFVVDTLGDMVKMVGRVGRLDPYECRRWAETRFSVDKMLNGYLENYYHILRTEGKIVESLTVA